MENLPKKRFGGIWRGVYQSIPTPKKNTTPWRLTGKITDFFFLMRRKSPIWDLADRKSFLPTNQKGCWHMGTLYLFVDPGFPHFHQRVCRFQPIWNNMLKSNLIISPDRDEQNHKTCLKPPSGKYGSSMSTIKYRIIVIYELLGTWPGIIRGFSWNGMVYCIVLVLYHAISRIKVFSKRSTPKINSQIGGQNRK